jgi:putative membrane protein
MRTLECVAIALTASIGLGCDGSARNETRTDPAGSAVGTIGEGDRTEVAGADRDFVNEAAVAGMAEVELGKLARERATDAKVKEFAGMMVRDHTAAGNKLDTIARQHSIPLPDQMDEKHRELRDRLSKLSGAEFDREYMQAMVDGHEDLVGHLESRVDKKNLGEWQAKYRDRSGEKVEASAESEAVMAEPSDDPVKRSINEWAAETYPVAYAHLEAAKTLAENRGNRMSQ